MQIRHRGLTIELADDDRRVGIIETVLFAHPLPPPLDAPTLPTPVVASSSSPIETPPTPGPTPPPPLSTVPANVRAAWVELEPIHRRELVLLAERPHKAEELERLLQRAKNSLGPLHGAITRVCLRHKARLFVFVNGRGRAARRFWLERNAVTWVKTLAAWTREDVSILPRVEEAAPAPSGPGEPT